MLADIPGLIEGAHEGVGIGDRFLGHVERTNVILHLVSAMEENPAEAYRTVRGELEAYGHGLADKPEILALSQIDTVDAKTITEKVKTLKKASGKEPLIVSSVSRGWPGRAAARPDGPHRGKAPPRRTVRTRSALADNLMTRRLAPYRRIVVKIGSALLVDRASGLKRAWLQSLARDIADLRAAGHEILVVSSGAIAMGRTVLDLPTGSLKLEESQAAAAVGQIALARAWDEALGTHEITTGQVLVTIDDTESRLPLSQCPRHHRRASAHEGRAGHQRERHGGDQARSAMATNDRLAARVATMMNADLLVILSDVDGLYTASPALDPDAKHLPDVPTITPEIEGDGRRSRLRTGARRHAHQGRGRQDRHPGRHGDDHHQGNRRASAQRARRRRDMHAVSCRRRAGLGLEEAGLPASWSRRGRLVVDAGAHAALKSGKSLLAAGVKRVEGSFERGDTLAIVLEDTGREIARGLAGYDSGEAGRIAGAQDFGNRGDPRLRAARRDGPP